MDKKLTPSQLALIFLTIKRINEKTWDFGKEISWKSCDYSHELHFFCKEHNPQINGIFFFLLCWCSTNKFIVKQYHFPFVNIPPCKKAPSMYSRFTKTNPKIFNSLKQWENTKNEKILFDGRQTVVVAVGNYKLPVND